MIPGSDLLADAFTAIDPVPVQYLKYGSRALNAVGQWVTTYFAAVTAYASVQAIPRGAYKQLGLDLQKKYVSLFVELDVVDLDRDQTGDRFILPDGLTYQIESETDWYGPDGGFYGNTGWVGPLLCVQVKFA